MSELKNTILAKLQQSHPAIASRDLAEKLEVYLILLHKWNQAYNLTAVRDINAMVGRHVFDSLAILPWLNGPRIIDVGSGAGLPGIPIALAMPDVSIVLLDSNGKKTRFLLEAKRVLALNNVEVIQSRVDNYHPENGFDIVMSRAFSNLHDMLNLTEHLLTENGVWVAMKGVSPLQELSDINRQYRVEPYTVKDVDGERCCVIIKK